MVDILEMSGLARSGAVMASSKRSRSPLLGDSTPPKRVCTSTLEPFLPSNEVYNHPAPGPSHAYLDRDSLQNADHIIWQTETSEIEHQWIFKNSDISSQQKSSMLPSSRRAASHDGSPEPYRSFEVTEPVVRSPTRLVPFSCYRTFIDRNPWEKEELDDLSGALRLTSDIPCFILRNLLTEMLTKGFRWQHRLGHEWVSSKQEVEQLIRETSSLVNDRRNDLASFVVRGLLEETGVRDETEFQDKVQRIWENQMIKCETMGKPDTGHETEFEHKVMGIWQTQAKYSDESRDSKIWEDGWWVAGPTIEPYRPDIDAENIMNQTVQTFENQVQIVRDTLQTYRKSYTTGPARVADGTRAIDGAQETIYQIIRAVRRKFNNWQPAVFEVDSNGYLAMLKIGHALADFESSFSDAAIENRPVFDTRIYKELTKTLRGLTCHWTLEQRGYYSLQCRQTRKLPSQDLPRFANEYSKYRRLLLDKVPHGTLFRTLLSEAVSTKFPIQSIWRQARNST